MSKKNKKARSKSKQPPLVVIDRDDGSDFAMVYADPEVAVVDRSIEKWGEHFCFEEYREFVPDRWRKIIGKFDDWDPKARARDIVKTRERIDASMRKFNKEYKTKYLPKLKKMWEEQGLPNARSEAFELPCVVIDRDAEGNCFIYADDDVVVFSRNAHIPEDMLYRYSPPAIPDGWLDRTAGFLGDGSAAEERALSAAGSIGVIECNSGRNE